MKQKELMVGDLVHLKGSKRIITVEEIFNVECGGRTIQAINGEWEGGAVIGWCDCDAIEPIPLTPEILEKNGFYKDWDNKTYLMGKLFRLSPQTNVEGWYLNKCFSMPIYSVHQLQHALRLCNMNELADNFKI